jgi:HSP20 family protein
MEIAYNRFKRVIELPTSLEQAYITTKYRDGMLLIWLEVGPQREL